MNAIIVIIAAVIGAAGAILGAYLTYWLARRSENQKLRREVSKLQGVWTSAWQTNSSTGNQWVEEDVKIDVSGGQLKLENEHNKHYRWVGEGTIVDHSFLAGTWESKNKDSSKGTFILILTDSDPPDTQGDALVGFFAGPNDGQFSNYGAWVMTQRPQNIDKAKLRLRAVGPTLPEIFG
jgi:hypothetical protein